jgi:CubicO group peptidase (beta-lactamase class C family)
MAAIDSGEPETLKAWASDALAPAMLKVNPGQEGIVEFLTAQQRDLGGFEVHRQIRSDDAQVEMLVRPREGARRWLRYVVNVEAAPPHRIAGLFVFPAPADLLPSDEGPLTAEAAARELEAAADRLAAGGRFSGAVLLAMDGKPLLRKAWGEAERSFHAANRPDTLFSLASMSKMFTAVAVGRLVEDGKLGWDDPVGRHLKGWLPDDVASKITIRHLLTHTSGLGDFLGDVASGDTLRLLDTISSHRPLVEGSRTAFEPGSAFQYSNTGYLLLGAVIEAISGRAYYDFVRDEVYAKAGMSRSGSYAMNEVVENRAVGYLRPGERGGDGWRSNAALKGLRGTSAGGSDSTVDDLVSFVSALTSYRLLRKDTTEALLVPRVKAPWGGDYGYGFGIEGAAGGGTVVGHAGGFPGVSTILRAYRPSGWTLVVLANVSSGPGEIAGAWDALLPRIR